MEIILNVIIYQIAIFTIILMISILVILEEIRLNNSIEKLKIEKEKTKNIDYIFSKYLNQNIKD